MPRVPPAVTAPAASRVLYPALSIAGNASRPMSVTTAPMIPEAQAKIAQVTTVATASAPGMRQVARCSPLNRRWIRLARSTR
jgi:hypothetical protein